jgi:hypothetical protein
MSKTLFLPTITKKMRSKNYLLAFSVTFFLLQFTSAYGQFDHAGSVYLGVGYNQALWYGKSTIHIEQGEVGNSYNMVGVKGNNKTNTPIGPTQLNYRLGYFFNYAQTMGIEISYDPMNYAIASQNVQVKGTFNSKLNQNITVPFSPTGSYYYHLSGLNLFMVNLVRRYEVYQNNAKSIRVDIMGKAGVGPAFPHISNRLGVNAVESGQLQWSGWDAGLEAGVRVTGYRYGYLELTGKYAYVNLTGMKVYNGTAEQKLHGFEVVATIGGALAVTRLNPLFTKEKRIVTILPWYQVKGSLGRKLRKKKIVTAEGDSLAINGISDIPEFDEITGRNYRRNHPMVSVPEDSIENNIYLSIDSAGHFISGDSSIVANYAEDHLSKKDLKKRKKKQKQDKKKAEAEEKAKQKELEAKMKATQDSIDAANKAITEPAAVTPPGETTPAVTPPADSIGEGKAPEEAKAPELSKKERKRKEKEEREALKRKEKEQRDEAKRLEKEKAEEAKRLEKEKAEATPPPAETKEPEKKEEVKEEPKAPEMSKKERKRKEKEEREERKRKEKEEADKKKEDPQPQPN